MIVDLKMLQEGNVDGILELYDRFYKLEMDRSKELDFKTTQKNQNKIKEFFIKYPYLTKKPQDMSVSEKQTMVTAFVTQAVGMMIYSGKKQKEINEYIAKYQNAESLTITELEDMRSVVYSTVKPYLSNERFFQNNTNNEYSAINFKITREELEQPELVDLLETTCLQLLEKGKQVKIVINTPMIAKPNESKIDYLLSASTMQRVIELNNHLRIAGMKQYVMFNEYAEVTDADMLEKSWTIKDVVKANRSIDNIVNNIKEQNLSPFETMVYIHKYITSNFSYQEGAMEECRVIPGIFKTNNIVCSGYASLVKAIVDKLDIPELKASILGCDFYRKSLFCEAEGGHCHNLIYIKDERYNIDGYYIEDACWDAKTDDKQQGQGVAHCMYPVGDLQHMRGMYYVQQEKQDRLSALMFDQEAAKKYVSAICKASKGEKPESEIKQYFDRIKKIKTGADVVVKYKNNSTPIPTTDYEAALHVVLAKFKLCEPDKIEETKRNILLQSNDRAVMIFDRKASSNFVANNPSAKRYNGTSSLRNNDGRQG